MAQNSECPYLIYLHKSFSFLFFFKKKKAIMNFTSNCLQIDMAKNMIDGF